MLLKTFINVLSKGLSGKEIVLIYQMGKVGSQTIEARLNTISDQLIIERLHFISKYNCDLFNKKIKLNKLSLSEQSNLNQQISHANEINALIYLRKNIKIWKKQSPKIKIIIGVRDIIGLMLANIFQTLVEYFPNHEEVTAKACHDLLVLENISEEKRYSINESFDFFNDWFDVELKSVIGIDIFEKPFSHDLGYTIYENNHACVLVYRLENFHIIHSQIENLLHKKIPSVTDKNLSSKKHYAKLYETIKKNLKLPKSYLELQYGSKLMKHFYSEQERQNFITHWTTPCN